MSNINGINRTIQQGAGTIATFMLVMMIMSCTPLVPTIAAGMLNENTAQRALVDNIKLAQTRPSSAQRCPPGTIGRYPHCRPRVTPPKRCPFGTTGRYPKCRPIVRPKCPRGTIGKWPKCKRIVTPRCPTGTYGRWPDCRRRVTRPTCPKGTKGRWPKCKSTARPRRPITKPPRRVQRPTVRPRRAPPPRRTVTLPADRRPDEIVVFLDQSQPGNVEFAIAQQYRLVRLQGENNQLLEVRIQRYRIPDRRSPADVIAAMQGDARVSLVQPNFLYRLQAGKRTNKPAGKGGSLSAMQYAPSNMQLEPAHKLATGRRAIVAVIDSGVDPSHPEIAGAVQGAFNAVGDRSPKPDAHGTAVAGIIGARARLLGVAPNVRLLAARAFFKEPGSKKPLTTTYILLRAIDWSFTNKARVLNLSFTGPHDDAVRNALVAAHRKGVILVAAAGNAGPRAPAAYPAAYRQVLAITALDKANRLYKKANQGSYVTAAAPGVNVLAPIPRGGYDVKSGTSFAAAHISGLIALMLERDPTLTSADIRVHIGSSANDLGPKGHDKQFGAGRANAFGALKAVINGSKPSLPIARTKPSVSKASDRR